MGKKLVLILVSLLILSSLSLAENFKDDLENLAKQNGKAYIQPLLTGFGTAVNSGLYKKASVSPGKLIPVGFDIGIVTSTAVVPDEAMSFEYTLDIPLNINNQSITLPYSEVYHSESNTTPTITSGEDGTTLQRKGNEEIVAAINSRLEGDPISSEDINIDALMPQNFSFPDGLNLAAVPMVALQANLRLPFLGLEITGRGFPEYEISDVGKFSFYGGGLRKSLPIPIIDVTVGAFYQTISLGDYFEVNNMNYHAELGKSIGLPFLFKFSPYVGIGLDQTEGTLEYTLDSAQLPGEIQNKDLKYSFTGENQVRVNAGLTAQIIPLTYLNLEVAQGKYLSGTVSIGLIFK